VERIKRIAMRRIRIRTLMLIVAVLALLLGSVGPGQRSYRRWSFYRSQAAVFARLEQSERLRASQELKLSADREAIRATLEKSPGFESRSPADQETAINIAVEFHRLQSTEARLASQRWAEKRWDCETAALWCWDPYAPDVP
jgi:hypothetical protein